MTDDKIVTGNALNAAAQRALSEAAERRTAQEEKEKKLAAQRSNEKGGPKEERVRFGDWEKGGRAVDF